MDPRLTKITRESIANEHSIVKMSIYSSKKNDERSDALPHMQLTLPPAQKIIRENVIGINTVKFSELLSVQMDPCNSGFRENILIFIQLMEKIRLAVQSNLGLSAIARELHETHHPIWVKKGKPDFRVEKDGQIKLDDVLYDSVELQSLLPKNTPKVLIIKDVSSEEGLSILYKTKFRSFSLHITSDGKVVSTLELNWESIYSDLLPEIDGQQHALRSFTPWQRHSESNFFNGRSTNKILMYMTDSYPSIFMYDSKSYYRDAPSQPLNINIFNAKKIITNNSNLYITLDASMIVPPKAFKVTSQHAILAVVRRKSPLMGNLFQLVPALYADDKLHLVLHGHQNETEIQKVFSCDFENDQIHDWAWQGKRLILKSNEPKIKIQSVWKSLHLLKHRKDSELIKYTASAPMVRASDAVMRKFWVSGFDIPTVYTEMITIADIFNISCESHQSPIDILEKLYYSESSTDSFRRLIVSEYEMRVSKHFAFQVVVPHESSDDLFFWGRNGENIARTTRMVIRVLHKIVPDELHKKMRFAVNMCCPAASIEKMGAGFGLRHKPEYIENIVHAIKEIYPALNIEFKTLMLSNADKLVSNKGISGAPIDKCTTAKDTFSPHKTSLGNNKRMCELMSAIGADGLVWQAKPRNEESYSLQAVLNVTKVSEVRTNFKFGYSGMVATLEHSQLFNLGYYEIGKPHYSVEGVLNSMKEFYGGILPDGFEVMLGRVLLGSSWLLLGRYASDQEIILMTLLQCFLLREFVVGAGPCGIDLMQVQVQYNVRHIIDDNLRDKLMSNIFEARSAAKIIDILYVECVSLDNKKDVGTVSLLKPSILKLKTAIESASAGRCAIYSDREKELLKDQTTKRMKICTFFYKPSLMQQFMRENKLVTAYQLSMTKK